MEALGGKDKQLAAAGRRLQRGVRDLRQGGRRTSQSTLHLLPGALAKTEQRPRQGRDGLQRARPDAARSCSRSRRRSAPAQSATTKLVAQDHADLQERDPPVRARNPAGRQRTRARHRSSSPKRSRSWRRSFAVLNEFFNELAYNPGPKQGRLPVLPRLGQPQPQQRASAAPTPTAPLGRSLALLQLRSAADPQRRARKSTRR